MITKENLQFLRFESVKSHVTEHILTTMTEKQLRKKKYFYLL